MYENINIKCHQPVRRSTLSRRARRSARVAGIRELFVRIEIDCLPAANLSCYVHVVAMLCPELTFLADLEFWSCWHGGNTMIQDCEDVSRQPLSGL